MLTIRSVIRKGLRRWVVDSKIDGKRVRRFFSSKAAAQACLADLRLQQREAGELWMSLDPKDQTELLLLYREIGDLGLSLSAVRGYLPRLAVHGKQAVTLAKAIEACLASKETARRRPKYVDSLAAMLARFAKGREQEAISAISTQAIEDWVNRPDSSAGSRATYLSRVNTLFSFAKRRGWIDVNPCDRIERITQERGAPAILTNEQARKALDFTQTEHPRFLAWLALALFAGIRPEELDQLRWDNLNLDSGTAVVDAAASKVRRRRIVHLEPAAIAWLRLAQTLESELPVPQVSRRRWIRALRDLLGFEDWPKDVLRHTAASHLLALKRDAAAIALELGNSPAVLLTHYRELVTREQTATFWDIRPSGS